jgi:hypothetical protein
MDPKVCIRSFRCWENFEELLHTVSANILNMACFQKQQQFCGTVKQQWKLPHVTKRNDINLRIWRRRHGSNRKPVHVEFTADKVALFFFVSMGVRGKPRMYLSLVGFLYRPFWTFHLWPPDASALTDMSRTPAAEGGTYGRGIRPVI